MAKTIFCICICILTAAAMTNWNPSTAQVVPTRIGTIDSEKILLTSNAGKAALAQLKKIQDEKEKQLGVMAQEIKSLQSAMQSGNGPVDGAAQLEARSIALRRAQDDATREISVTKDKMLADMDTKIMPVINAVGKEMNYAAIFRKFESGLIYADDSTDLTNAIIARLNSTVQ